MKKLVLGTMMAVSLLLTACAEFNTIDKNSNEVLDSLSPYLSEEDQVLAQELSSVYSKDIKITESILDPNTIELEIEGILAELQIINKGKLAFLFNGKKIFFEDLKNNNVFESLISTSLLNMNPNASAILSLVGSKDPKALLNTVFPSMFGLVSKGVFNFSLKNMIEKATEALNGQVGGSIGQIGTELLGGLLNGTQPNQSNLNSIGSTLLNSLLGTFLEKFTGLSSLPINNNGNSGNNPVQQNPLFPNQGLGQDCNLFCSLFGLLMNNVIK